MSKARTMRCVVSIDIPTFLGMESRHGRHITQLLLAQFRAAVFKGIDSFCEGKLSVIDGADDDPISVTLVRNVKVDIFELED